MLSLNELIHSYGYAAIVTIVALECIGIPLPGEIVLAAAAIYAGSTHDLNIWLVIVAAATGAFAGNTVGFAIGHHYGYRLLLRYGTYIGLNDDRIKIGQYLFRRHGAKVVIFARFVALLRSVGGILAGANRMPWRPFLFANALGAIVWAALYGTLAFAFGDQVHKLMGPVGLGLGIVAVLAIAVGLPYLARREAQLLADAERAFPGPLRR
ncbi:MAG: DedA family protein [Xanthobacteraceae bacterium]